MAKPVWTNRGLFVVTLAVSALLVSATVAGLGLAGLLNFGKVEDGPVERYVVFAGGNEEFEFSKTIARGALRAGEDLDVDVEVVWSDWDISRMIVQFKEKINERPEGIAVMGHPGSQALKPLVDEAYREGIAVSSLNVPLPELFQEYSNSGFGYVGQRLESSGAGLAEAAVKRFGLSSGDKVLVFGTAALPARGERTRSALAVFEAAQLNIIYEEALQVESREELREWQRQTLRERLREHEDMALIFDDIEAEVTAGVLRELQYGPDRVQLAGFDLLPTTIRDLDEGYIDLLSDQQPFLQGYLSVLQMKLAGEWQFHGLEIDTGTGILTPHKADLIEPLVALGIR